MSSETYISHAGNRGSIPLGAISPLHLPLRRVRFTLELLIL